MEFAEVQMDYADVQMRAGWFMHDEVFASAEALCCEHKKSTRRLAKIVAMHEKTNNWTLSIMEMSASKSLRR